jgi:hypothetical protein
MNTQTETNGTSTAELQDVLAFLGALAAAIVDATTDHTINLKDLKYLFRVLPTVRPAFDGIDTAFDELRTLTDDETAQMGLVFAEAANLPNSSNSQEISSRAVRLAGDLSFVVQHIVRAKNQTL